ncbi:MAG: Ig-like domain-containing protein [Clostridia bacterium]
MLPPENAGDLTVPIKAQAEGEAIITATTVDGSFMAASVVKVTKAAAERELDELKISDKSLTLKVGETKQLTLTAEYEDDTEEDVTATAEWVSIPKAVVEVNGGLVTAKAAGKGMVLASFGGEFVKVEVKVVNESQLKKLEVTPGSVKLAVGGTKQMQLKAVYENGNSEDVTAKAVWKSSDESQATVSEAGLITAVAKGNPIVTASFGGKSVPVKVEIKAAAQKEIHKLEIVTDKGKKGKLDLKQGDTATFKVIAVYKDKTEEDVTASVSYKITGGKNVISVENSTITANGKGTAVLFAQYQKKNAKLTVQVKK